MISESKPQPSPPPSSPHPPPKTPWCSQHMKLDGRLGMRAEESLQPEVQSFGQRASISVCLTASPILPELPLGAGRQFFHVPPDRFSAPSGAGSQDLRAGKTQTSTAILGTRAV